MIQAQTAAGRSSAATPGTTRRGDAPSEAAPAVPESLRELWERHREDTWQHVRLIDGAISALTTGHLDDEHRREAQRAAHMLAGTVGTFGFTRASEAAHHLELEFETAARGRLPTMAALTAIVRRELEGTRSSARGSGATSVTESLRILIVEGDAELSKRIAAAGASRGILCDTAANPAEARELVGRQRPAIALVDLALGSDEVADAYELLSELSGSEPPIPVLVLTESDAFTDRVEAARRGSRAFLPKACPPAELLDAVEQFSTRERLAATRVLVVDDDPLVLETMQALLRPHEIDVFTLSQPLQFWERLEEIEPELLILDVDMPGFNGPELCRTVRNDPRWSHLAVMFATARTDAATIELVFNAGTDDYVAKPIVGPELLARVSNRLERVRLFRAAAETDGLTGLANRVTSEQGLKQLIALSDRFREPVAAAMLDVDRFKRINDTRGHAAGDGVLRRLAEYLRREFRGNDVLGRWGGEEFIVAMYGMTRANAVRRLTDVLAWFSNEEFESANDTFQVSFSAGVAEYPLDADNVDALCEAADRALYRAKESGRARVLPAQGAAARTTDER